MSGVWLFRPFVVRGAPVRANTHCSVGPGPPAIRTYPHRHNISAITRLRRDKCPNRGHVAWVIVGVDEVGAHGQRRLTFAWPMNRLSSNGPDNGPVPERGNERQGRTAARRGALARRLDTSEKFLTSLWRNRLCCNRVHDAGGPVTWKNEPLLSDCYEYR
jgi:hypothetical protein